MNILITSAGSELARNVAGALAEEHTLRLTELYPVDTGEGTFVQSELGHDESTNELVRGIDTIIHIAEISPGSPCRSRPIRQLRYRLSDALHL